MRITHLTSAHPPFDTRILHHEAASLARAGHDVALVVPHMTGALVKGVRIIAVERAKNRRDRVLKTAILVYGAARRENADAYHLHDPDLLVPVGVLLRMAGHRVIYDAHEDYSLQFLSKDWIHPWLRPLAIAVVRLAEWIAALSFDAIVAATPSIARRFPPSKTWVIQNFPDVAEFGVSSRAPYSHRPNIAVYVGGIAEIRGAREMVEAIGMLPDRLAARLALAGPFEASALRDSLSELSGWERVQYSGVLSRDAVDRLLATARVGLVIIRPVPNYLESYPTKLFEYMQAGMPVVVSDFPLWRRMIVDAGCGLAVNPCNPDELAAALTWILDNPREAEQMGARGQALVRDVYSWEQEARKLVAMYGRLEASR